MIELLQLQPPFPATRAACLVVIVHFIKRIYQILIDMQYVYLISHDKFAVINLAGEACWEGNRCTE